MTGGWGEERKRGAGDREPLEKAQISLSPTAPGASVRDGYALVY